MSAVMLWIWRCSMLWYQTNSFLTVLGSSFVILVLLSSWNSSIGSLPRYDFCLLGASFTGLFRIDIGSFHSFNNDSALSSIISFVITGLARSIRLSVIAFWVVATSNLFSLMIVVNLLVIMLLVSFLMLLRSVILSSSPFHPIIFGRRITFPSRSVAVKVFVWMVSSISCSIAVRNVSFVVHLWDRGWYRWF